MSLSPFSISVGEFFGSVFESAFESEARPVSQWLAAAHSPRIQTLAAKKLEWSLGSRLSPKLIKK